MIHFHCWHYVPGTLRKVRKPSRCRSSEPKYLRYADDYWYVQCQMIEKCCICHKRRIANDRKILSDRDIAKIPDILDEPLAIEYRKVLK